MNKINIQQARRLLEINEPDLTRLLSPLILLLVKTILKLSFKVSSHLRRIYREHLSLWLCVMAVMPRHQDR